VARVLKPGGRFYAEEVLARFINHHPEETVRPPRADRFDAASFEAGLAEAGLLQRRAKQLAGAIAWFTAARPTTGPVSSARPASST
jgi:hypothetical protein